MISLCSMVAFFHFAKDYCAFMGEARDISPRKLALIKFLIQESDIAQPKIVKKVKI